MKIKKLKSSPIVIQAMVLFSISIIHLILRLFKFTFEPSSIVILIILDSSVVFFIVYMMKKAMKEKENAKLSKIICLFLPLIILLHSILKFFTIVYDETSGIILDNIYLFILLLFSTIQISICAGKRSIGTILCLLNSIILFIIFLSLFIVIYFLGFSKKYVYDTEISPGNKYKIEIIVSDRSEIGAGYDNIYFKISRVNSDINIFIGTLKKDRIFLDDSKFGMFVEWGTDEIFFINGTRYIINDFDKGDYLSCNANLFYQNKDNYNYFISKIERFHYADSNVIVSYPLSKYNFDILINIKYDSDDDYIELPYKIYEGIIIDGISLDGLRQRFFKKFIVNDNKIYYVIEYSTKSSPYHVVELSNEEKELIMSLLDGE